MLNRYAWVFALAGIVLLAVVQIWSTTQARQQTDQLHELSIDTQSQALQLSKEIGYGGLIHNFKNLILRPDNKGYYSDGVQSAVEAFSLVNQLEKSAVSLGVTAELTNTRAMISAYRTRLDQVVALNAEGLSMADVDAAVRFNDDFALIEISTLQDNLSNTINDRINGIAESGLWYTTFTVIGTVLLGGLAIGLLLNQRQKQKHLSEVNAINQQLGSSNHDLSTANSSLMQFSGIVSHDLRAPLRHISMFNELIMEDYEDRDSVQEHVERIRTASSRMEAMIQSLLEFTRAGFAEPNLQRIDVDSLVKKVVADLQPSIEASDAKVILQLQGYAMADPELIERVLHNLIANSLKYTHPDQTPEIQIESRREGDHIQFSISDNGIGIEPQFAEKIFKPFERLHDVQSEFKGTGIGLSLVRAVIDAHDGDIALDTSYTDGSRFVFHLQAA